LDLAHRVDQANSTHAPIVVHCSAGIGRSGTFCTVHSTIEKLRKDLQDNIDPKFSIVKNIIKMRQQRPGMVQTKEQYMFVYLTIMEEIDRLLNNKKTSTANNKTEDMTDSKELYEKAHNDAENMDDDGSDSDDDTDGDLDNNNAKT